MGRIDLPPCGTYCKNCLAYNEKCKGCTETEGKPFYSKRENREKCPVFECASKTGVVHCGLCEEFPCHVFLDCYSRRRGVDTVLRRAGLLAMRKKIGDLEWIKWLNENDIKFGG